VTLHCVIRGRGIFIRERGVHKGRHRTHYNILWRSFHIILCIPQFKGWPHDCQILYQKTALSLYGNTMSFQPGMLFLPEFVLCGILDLTEIQSITCCCWFRIILALKISSNIASFILCIRLCVWSLRQNPPAVSHWRRAEPKDLSTWVSRLLPPAGPYKQKHSQHKNAQYNNKMHR